MTKHFLSTNIFTLYARVMRTFVLMLALLVSTTLVMAASKPPVVIVTSYNPDVKSMSDNVATFTEQFLKSGLKNQLVLENMHCNDMTECDRWTPRLWSLLEKYYGEDGKAPAAVVLLGAEASSAYFSIDRPELKSTPIVLGLRNRMLVKIPTTDSIGDIARWHPQAFDLCKDFEDYNIVGGRLYTYDIKKNVDLIRDLFPNRDSLVILTDNSWGGITLRAAAEHSLKKDAKEYNLRFIDGRTISFAEVDAELSQLNPKRNVLMLGSWRYDNSNRFQVRNTTYALAMTNPELPVITFSSVGMGFWAVAGYTPQYHVMGAFLADEVVNYLKTGKPHELDETANQYKVDVSRIDKFGIRTSQLTFSYEAVNEKTSFFEENKYIILAVVMLIAILLTLLVIALRALRVSRRLSETFRRHSEDMKLAKQRAEEANHMKSVFIANMSHEIRTPLNAVVGFSQLLTMPGMEYSEEEKAEYGDLIMTNTNMLLKLINDILDISKIDAGKMKYEIKPVNVKALCNVAVVSANATPVPGVEIYSEVIDENLMIDSDEDRLLQLITNLMNNAKKFTEKGSIVVEAHAIDDGANVQFSITDTGIGIPPEKAEAVFERFQKLNTFKQGTGLGLSIVRSIVEHYGGKVWVDTNYNSGARFVFVLPSKWEEK